MTPRGVIRPMSFAALEKLASEWAGLLPSTLEGGATSLLRTARSLFVHSWFDYEFMAVPCLVGFQAMEASFRELYPAAAKKQVRSLVRLARDEGILPASIADLAETGVELRNLYAHPATQGALSVGVAVSMLENSHRLVALVLATALR